MDARQVTGGALVGVVFGATLSWSGMADPAVIREALLFEDAYLYLMFASAVLTAVVGQRLLVARGAASCPAEPPRRRHITGSLLFGLGWGVTGACPGPIAAQLGQGVPWAPAILAGALLGVWLHLRRGAPETEPASG